MATGDDVAHGIYPERADRNENGFDAWTREMLGGLWQRLRPHGRAVGGLIGAAGALADSVAALDDEGGIAFRLPINETLSIVFISFLLGVLAAVYPAWRATRVNVVEAIATA